jgi:glycosyltransferase involved in cell wall biosynthesis
MGRVARGVLRELLADPRFDVTLIARARDRRALRNEYPNARVAAPDTARRRTGYDVAWYPFNGMRFEAAAPALVTMHDAFAFTEANPERIARMREQGPIRRAARRAAKIVTDSQWSRVELARELGLDADAIAVVPPAPDAFFFPAADDVVPAALACGRFVLVVGAREARKNAQLALEACARSLRGPRETLAIVGELAPRERALALALRLRCGEISPGDETLRALYRKAAIVLVPSRAEGFGLVAVEALACGAAVVAADAAALPEATQGAAILLAADDVAAWAAAIRRLLDDETLLEAHRARARALFATSDRSAYAKRMAELLRETAGDRP